MLKRFFSWFLRPRSRPAEALQPGQILSGFIARDVVREIEVIAIDRLSDGIIVARIRTINVLYVSKGITPEPEFDAPREVRVDEMWHWSGRPWGGLPDGTSAVGSWPNPAHLDADAPDSA